MIPNRLRLATLLAVPFALSAQSPCHTRHLTIFDANLAEFLEERTLDLQSGSNAIEWRGIMPQTYVRTIRVTLGDGIMITRRDVTYDGPEVRNQKSPVLHLTVQNPRVSGPHKVQIDYLAPGLSWRGDYSLLLARPAASDSHAEMELDSWVTVQNDTGADICADFSITQGRSNLIRGTRRIIDRRTVSDASAINRYQARYGYVGFFLSDSCRCEADGNQE